MSRRTLELLARIALTAGGVLSAAAAPAQNQAPAAAEETAAGQGGPGRPVVQPGVEAVLEEEHSFFDKRLVVEAGLTYTRSDRRQLNLSGFLALDAIFLGRIQVDEVKADVLQFDVGARYTLTDRWQLDLNVPFLYRSTTYLNSNAGMRDQADVSLDPTLGDVSFGINYRLFRETPSIPDIVATVQVKAPTGTDPFGVKVRNVGEGDVTLNVPEELSSGSGVWAVSSALSFVRSVDPAVLFANISYFHNFEDSFDDINPTPGQVTPGDVKLGDSIQFGVGTAVAFNERLSMSFSYSQRLTEETETRIQGGAFEEIIGSDANAASFNLGLTYALGKRLSLVTGLGIGLTPDAPDVTVSIKFPFSF